MLAATKPSSLSHPPATAANKQNELEAGTNRTDALLEISPCKFSNGWVDVTLHPWQRGKSPLPAPLSFDSSQFIKWAEDEKPTLD